MGTVVDERLRVHGVEGLHVADCSVFPDVPRANTASPQCWWPTGWWAS